MICVVIKGPTYKDAHQQISESISYADLIEIRLDFFEKIDLTELKQLRKLFSIDMIFTLRSSSQGGLYSNSEEERLETIFRIAQLLPEYMDLEDNVDSLFLKKFSLEYPQIKIIISHHNFTHTPDNLDDIYNEMRKTPAFFYKIAVTAKSSLDALRLLSWKKKCPENVIAISMGTFGQISRILAPTVGSPITYTTAGNSDSQTLGQVSAKILIDQYHIQRLSSKTALFGLIGSPVARSISDETHNELIQEQGIDAVYVKIEISPSEISEFFHLTKQLPFQGISVTMPLKEHILPHLDYVDAQALEIGAVNTVHFLQGKTYGFNTDGIGALNAIEKKCTVVDKKVVIIGAGGAAQALAFEAKNRGAKVLIVNRDETRALKLANRLGCKGLSLDKMADCAKEGYDVLINCTPSPMPISIDDILSNALMMDITTKPKETFFLKNAKEKGCQVVYGYEMFIEQALGQFQLWLGQFFDVSNGRKILEKCALKSLQFKDTTTEHRGGISLIRCLPIDLLS